MEEVDAILLTQLREIGCDLDEDVQGMSGLECAQVMKCVRQCLANILGPSEAAQLPTDICESMNMSSKYKAATQLTDCIKDLGYKADLGYQTFMYINEHDIRRLLLFLIERIARDDEKNEFEPAEERNGAELSVRRKLRAMDWDNVWVPYDTEQTKNTAYLTHLTRLTPQVSTSPAFHLQAFLSKSLSKKVQVYAKHKLSQQSSNTNELLPTAVADILEWNARNWTKSSQADEEPDLLRLTTHRTHRLVTRTKAKVNKIEEVHRQKLREEIREDQPQEEAGPEVNKEEVYARRISQLEAELAEADEKLRARRGAQTELNNCEADYKNKCKLLEAAFKSRQELLADIETLREQIEQMTESWESLQAQLRDQLKTRHQESVAHNEQVSRKLAELRQLTKSITSGLSEVDAKEALVAELTAKTPAQWPPNRGSYTRRIIEIIANVSRQNAETRKVLLETRKVQRDINTLEGKIRRCLAVADEAIFREARENEWCRSCYLLLAQLQANCNQLVDHVGDIGATRRETRRLEEMVENEKSRSTASNLSRIKADAQQIERENEQLRAQIEQKKGNNNV